MCIRDRLVITLIPGGVLTTAHAAQATLTPDAVVNPADNVTLSKTAVQTAIDEWEVTLQISGGGSTTVKPQIDIVLVTDYSDSMDEPVYGSGGVCGSTSFRADEETKRVCAKCGSDDIEWKGGIFTGRWQCEKCRSTNIVKRQVTKGWWCSNCDHYYKGENHPASCTQEQGSIDLGSRREIAQKAQVALVDSCLLYTSYKGEYVALKEARKHAAWYLKGVHGAARLRGRTGSLKTLSDLENLIQDALEEEQKAAFPQ